MGTQRIVKMLKEVETDLSKNKQISAPAAPGWVKSVPEIQQI